jgi:hypothetical protein
MMTVSMLLLAGLANAQPETVTVWTDKSEYTAGETGTLHIVFYNNMGKTVTIENITITFESWKAYKSDQWEGNQTIEVKEAFVAGKILQNDVSFTVPTDGRAVFTFARVKIYADAFIPDTVHEIYVSQTPPYMEQIVTLLTVLVVLLIVCTIIIAATIFLSARRPQVMWRPAEKAE